MNGAIFVFGSNLAGRHGKGAARWAKQRHGAIYGQGEGRQGSSYAIPTKDEKLKTLPLFIIERHIRKFLEYAEEHHELTFEVTPVGCGLAGYSADQIAPLFASAGANVGLPLHFLAVLYSRGYRGPKAENEPGRS
jgi:hypothetical protein